MPSAADPTPMVMEEVDFCAPDQNTELFVYDVGRQKFFVVQAIAIQEFYNVRAGQQSAELDRFVKEKKALMVTDQQVSDLFTATFKTLAIMVPYRIVEMVV